MEIGYRKHQQQDKTLAQRLNPINWKPMVWGWLMLFVVAVWGMYAILYRSPVEPQRRASVDQQKRVMKSGPSVANSGERSSRSTSRTNPAVYENSSSGRNGTTRRSGPSSSRSNRSRAGSSGGDKLQASEEGSFDAENLPGEVSVFPKVYSGQHINKTTPFQSPGEMTINWETTGPMFQLMVKRQDGGMVRSAVSKSGLSGRTSGTVSVKAKGKIYFKVNSLGKWQLKVDA